MSKTNGFHISLSGGKNSTSVALIIFNLCRLVYNHITIQGSVEVLADLRTIIKDKIYYPTSEKEICSKILFTTYMET